LKKENIVLTRSVFFCFKFLTQANAKGREGSTLRPKSFRVPVDYDQTPYGRLAAWDERMIDEDVARVMRMIYTPTPNRDFANSNCQTVGVHFTPPYSKIAKEKFGYGTCPQGKED
jgi:hypothetical protein